MMNETWYAFNRTSMESKHPQDVQDNLVVLYNLLIEPVWNRNVSLLNLQKESGVQLLIEPVWNRNS